MALETATDCSCSRPPLSHRTAHTTPADSRDRYTALDCQDCPCHCSRCCSLRPHSSPRRQSPRRLLGSALLCPIAAAATPPPHTHRHHVGPQPRRLRPLSVPDGCSEAGYEECSSEDQASGEPVGPPLLGPNHRHQRRLPTRTRHRHRTGDQQEILLEVRRGRSRKDSRQRRACTSRL